MLYTLSFFIRKCSLLTMSTTCVAPNCKSGYRSNQKKFPDEKYSWHKFPSVKDNIELRKLWISAIPRSEADGKEYIPPDDARLCNKHFHPSDFELMHQNVNVTNKNSNDGFMKNAQPKQGAVPSVWPGCPAHLPKTRSERPTRLATSQARIDHESALAAHELEEEMRQDTFSSLDKLVEKIDSVTLPDNIRVIQKQNHVAFLNIFTDDKPIIKYCLKLNSEL